MYYMSLQVACVTEPLHVILAFNKLLTQRAVAIRSKLQLDNMPV